MIRSESRAATADVSPSRSGLLGPDGDCHPVVEAAPDESLEDETPLRGVVAIDVPREVIAEFSVTFNLNELPEWQPEILFDHGPRSRDDDDEQSGMPEGP
jgi:hypothetical protein